MGVFVVCPADRYLSEDDVDAIQKAFRTTIKAEFDARSRVQNDVHTAHHEWLKTVVPWIDARIQREADREKMRKKIIEQVVGWGVIVALAGFASMVYQHVVDAVSKAAGK